MKFDHKSGYWIDSDGHRFVRNEFEPTNPTFIAVTTEKWTGWRLNHKHCLSWPSAIDPSLKAAIEDVLKDRMRRSSPSSLKSFSLAIKSIVSAQSKDRPITPSALLDASIVRHIWDATKPSYRPWVRTLIRDLGEAIDPIASSKLDLSMTAWKANRSLNWRTTVLRWDPEQGSLTSAELEILRKHLAPPKAESTMDHYARLLTWLTLTTLKRPAQLVTIKPDALRRITTNIGTTADILIPLVKGQAGHEARWNPIPNNLADDIDAYRNRNRIKNTEAAQEVLLPMVSHEGADSERIFAPYGAVAKNAMQTWIKKIGVVSPRTNGPLRVNGRRLRHTGATHLAMQGSPLELIQDVLEHENLASSRYYIDAVGIEYLPAFEKADRNLGGRFSMMHEAWFKGKVINRNEAPQRPIIVPDSSAPAVVGACGQGGHCPVHPLFSCYSCPHFLAFRDADHQKVLDFLDEEYERWRAAETSNSRSKAIKDFDRAAAGVREVINLLGQEHPNAAY